MSHTASRVERHYARKARLRAYRFRHQPEAQHSHTLDELHYCDECGWVSGEGE